MKRWYLTILMSVIALVLTSTLFAEINKGLWGYYPIQENDFNDYSGNERHGLAVDSVVTCFDEEQNGYVADFTANPEGMPRILLGTDDPAHNDEISISVWVYWFGLNGYWQGICGKSYNGKNRRWIFQVKKQNGQIKWLDVPTEDPLITPDEGVWQHLAVTYANGVARFYKDGYLVAENTDTSLDNRGEWADARVTIGFAEDRTDSTFSKLWFNGMLDEIRIYERALTEEEVIMTMEARTEVKVSTRKSQRPSGFVLEQNYPNPFNPVTTISFELPKVSKTTLSVYDLSGRQIRVLKNEVMPAGKHSVRFHAHSLPSGVYLYQLRANDVILSKKAVLIK